MKKNGYTLTEILIVVVIIGLIAAIALPNLGKISTRNNTARAKADLRSLQLALESYYLHNNSSYPAALSSLTAATPTIVRSIPRDPYAASAYGYGRSPNAKYYVVYSVGPARSGGASVSDAGVVTEAGGDSCIYVSNAQEDALP